LTGKWLFSDGQMHGDATEDRIHWLIKNVLIKLRDSPEYGAWETLFRDPADGRLWERTYPNGGLQGGGPLQLECIGQIEAAEKYGAF
jgi:hypothetical protein